MFLTKTFLKVKMINLLDQFVSRRTFVHVDTDYRLRKAAAAECCPNWSLVISGTSGVQKWLATVVSQVGQ